MATEIFYKLTIKDDGSTVLRQVGKNADETVKKLQKISSTPVEIKVKTTGAKAATQKWGNTQKAMFAGIAIQSDKEYRKVEERATKAFQQINTAQEKAQKTVTPLVFGAPSQAEVNFAKKTHQELFDWQAKQADKVTKDQEKAKRDAIRRQEKEEKNSLDKSAKNHGEWEQKVSKTLGRISRSMMSFLAIMAFREVYQGFKDLVGMGIEYNAIVEQSKLGVASLFLAEGQFVDVTGKATTGMEGFNRSMAMSQEVLQQLQVDNLETIATYEQLVKAYQQTLAPGLAAGFNPEQIRQFTVGMVQAAGAMGMNLDMLAEETRSMLRGTINPRQTLIATALGIRPEDIRQYKGDAEGLFTYIMGRLEAFKLAGAESQKTWVGMISNVKDAMSIALGKGFEGFFNRIKVLLGDVQKGLVRKNEKGVLEIDPEVVKRIERVSGFFEDAIDGAEGLYWALSKAWNVFEMILRARSIANKGIALGLTAAGQNFMQDLQEEINNLPEPIKNFAPIREKVGKVATEALETIGGKQPEVGTFWEEWENILTRIETKLKSIQQKQDELKYGKPPTEAEKTTYQYYMTGGQDQYVPYPEKPAQAEIDMMMKLRGLTKERSVEDQARAKNLKDEVGSQIDLNSLTTDQLMAVAQLSEELKKAGVGIKRFENIDVIKDAIDAITDKMGRGYRSAIIQNTMHIAEQNKNYEEQVRLIDKATQLDIERLTKEQTAPKPVVDSRRALGEQQKQMVGRVEETEMLNQLEQYAALQAESAALVGNLEEQAKWEGVGLDATIRKQRINLEMKGTMGDLNESQMRMNKAQADALRMSQQNLNVENMLLSSEQEIAGMADSYEMQAQLIEKTNTLRLAELVTTGKLSKEEFLLVKAEMDRVAAIQGVVTILQGEGKHREAIVKSQAQLAQYTYDLDAIQKSELASLNAELQTRLKVLKTIAIMTDDYRAFNRAQEEAGMQVVAFVESQKDAKLKGLAGASDDINNLQNQLFEMTGQWQAFDATVNASLAIKKQSDQMDVYRKGIADTLDTLRRKIEDVQRTQRMLGQEENFRGYRVQIEELIGSYGRLKQAEIDLLEVQNQRVQISNVSDREKKASQELTDLRKKELQAMKEMNGPALVKIGIDKGANQSAQDLANAYENLIPNAIDSSTNAMENFILAADYSRKGIAKFVEDFGMGIAKLIADLGFAIVKMELLQSLSTGKKAETEFNGLIPSAWRKIKEFAGMGTPNIGTDVTSSMESTVNPLTTAIGLAFTTGSTEVSTGITTSLTTGAAEMEIGMETAFSMGATEIENALITGGISAAEAISTAMTVNSKGETADALIEMFAEMGLVKNAGGGGGGGGFGDMNPSDYTNMMEGVDFYQGAAKGGVFKNGWVPFRKFSSGGITKRPTLGLVGEGGQNEAVVPLPDGKSIPVDLKNGGEKEGQVVNHFHVTIQALDAKSLHTLMMENPGAITGPFLQALNKGDRSLISNLRRVK